MNNEKKDSFFTNHILAISNAVAGTPEDFRANVEGPRHPAKNHVCIHGNNLYTEMAGEISVRDVRDLQNPVVLTHCPPTLGRIVCLAA